MDIKIYGDHKVWIHNSPNIFLKWQRKITVNFAIDNKAEVVSYGTYVVVGHNMQKMEMHNHISSFIPSQITSL